MNPHAPVSKDPWFRIPRKPEDTSLDLCDETCERARLDAAKLANPSAVNGDGSVDIAMGFDQMGQIMHSKTSVLEPISMGKLATYCARA